MRVRAMVMGVAALSGLSACGAPPPLPPTVVNVTLVASVDDNPTTDGKGAPLALRVYQLAGSANFASAEFFPLYNSDSAALKTDLLQRDDFLLAPGATKSETTTAKDNVTAIGVFGAYRGFQTAVWHVSFPVVPHQITNATITAGHDGLVLKTETIAPK